MREPVPIAIVGAACRLPGAPDFDAFAQLLLEGRDAVTEVPADRFTHARFLHPRPGEIGRTPHFRAGVIGDVAAFDAPAFGLSPREADEMDPQQRLLLMLARRAFEDAGWPEEAVAGQEVGVYVGASTTDYADLRQQDHGSSDRYIMTGGALSIASNRLGHVFDLHGPAMTLDTACSSALVALHAACEALRAGQIPAAVVGGVNMLLSPFPFGGFWRAGMLSLRGRCQAFGAGADGYVRAEGGVVLILKPLDAALRDGDAVRGVIMASGVNAAGRTTGISLPNGAAQTQLIARVLRDARIAPAALGYFEAHGTGTPAGDPIEAAAIARAVAGRASPLPIGSAKSNIGHTEAASGLVGVLKALVVLETGRIPATLHAAKPNPLIPFEEYGLAPANGTRAFEGEAVAVNSFGFGGTNACVALMAAPRPGASPPAAPAAPPPLLLTARGEEQLASLAAAWEARLAGLSAPHAAALIRGQARHRDLLPHRLVLRGFRRGDDWAAALAEHRQGAAPEGVVAGIASPGRGVAFVFSGNGAQWAGMAQAELRTSKAFRAGMERADAALRPHLGWSVLARLRRGITAEALADTEQAQPLLFAIQHAVVASLAAEGIRPALCIGHSVGEVAAAEAAGLLSLGQAARLIVVRSSAQARTAGQGRMAALGASLAEAGPLLAECSRPGELPLEVAAINGPAALTIAGPAAALERLGEAARAARLSWLPLDLDFAFHSAAMDPVRSDLLDGLRGLRQKAGTVPMISSVTGAALSPGECRPAYWWRNLREPVRFAAAIEGALAGPLAERPAVFLEIGPNPVLQGYLRACLKAAGSQAEVLPTLRRGGPGIGLEGDPFPRIADRATACGADPRAAPAFAGPAEWRGLPPAPHAPRYHWFPRSPEATGFVDAACEGRLLGFRHLGTEAGEEWRRSIDTLEEPWLADHALAGQAVLPAAAMLEMALEAGFARHRQAVALEISDFSILRPLPLSPDTARETRCRLDAEGLFTLEARRRLSEEGWTLHARGRVTFVPALPDPAALALEADWAEGSDITTLAARQGLDYGPAFRPISLWRADAAGGLVEAMLERPATAPEDAEFHLHPVRLDGAMQALLALLDAASPSEGGAEFSHLPVRFARMTVRCGATFPVRAEASIEDRGQRGVTAGLVLRDGAGLVQAVVSGALFQRLPRIAPAGAADEPLAFRTVWRAAALPNGWPQPARGMDIAALEPPAALAPPLDDAALLLAAHGVAMSMDAGAALFEGPLAEALRTRAHALDLDHEALPAPGAIWQQVLFEQPSLAQELAVLAEAAESLPAALAGLPMSPAVLSPHAESLRRMAEALAESTAALLVDWPQGRPCRVLLVGAEDGPLFPALQRGLASLGDALRLTVTHLPDSRPPPVPVGAELLAWDPTADVPAPAEGDLVLALALSPRCGASPRMAETLRAATAPGGVLLLAEPMPGMFWDMTEGLAPAWWSAPRLRDAAGWEAVLSAGGWAHSRQLPLPPLPWEAALIAAAKPAGGLLLNAAPARRFAIWAGAGQQPWADALADALAAAGAQVQHLPDSPLARSLRGVSLIALPAPVPGSGAALGRLAALADGTASQFHLVLRDAEHDPAAAGHLAMARVLVNELASLRPVRHDLAAELTPAEAALRLSATLLNPPDAHGAPQGEERLTASARFVPMLELLPPAAPVGSHAAPADPRLPLPARLEVGVPGQLGTLAWQPAPDLLAAPGEGEVVLRIAATGLNFRDLMWAQNLLPEEALQPGFAGPGLGMEASGIVEAVGHGVALRPGQAVFGFARRALASRAITHAAALAPLPRGLGMVEAASLPVAFLTAIHALEGLARLQPEERVLIHGAAGAVGLAALQVALAAGARVAVTAGTEARRAFLRAAGAEVALNSRDTSFAEELRAHWPAPAGEGCVDVCLNSLSGEAMERSLHLMAPFGRFLELGKRDFAESRRVALRPLRRNVAWFAVDLDEVARRRPAMAARLLASLATRLEDGAIRPLPTRRYPAELAEEAFRQLQAGGHIGKLVITPPEERPLAPGRAWRPEGTVVVIGGAAGFGLEAACWLAGQGVQHLALVSRRGPATPGAADAVARLAGLGAKARIIAADATDEAALAAALDVIRADMPPIGGVVQAAAVFADGISARLETSAVEAVWAAKAGIAGHLDRLTRQDPVQLFLLFSSATVPIGSPGQAAYVAANAAMEAIARRRHAEGLPALAVQWGPISDAGVLADDPSNAAGLSQRLGTRAMTAAAALASLPRLLDAGLPVLGLACIDWEAAHRRLRLLAEPGFAAVAGGAGPGEAAEEDPLRAIAEAGPDAGLEIAQRIIGREVSRILRLPTGAVPMDTPLQRLGLDSLGSIELRTGLERRFSASIPLQTTTEELTVNALARAVLAQIPVARDAAE